MAGLGQFPFAQPFASPSSSHRPLPKGPCNHRDKVGACGCRQFWDKSSAELHHASRERRPDSERSTFCMCGHHACFHEASHAPPAQSKREELLQESPILRSLNHNHSNALEASQALQASQAKGSAVDEQGRGASLMSSTTGLPRVPSVCLLSHDRYPAANAVARENPAASIAGLGLSMLNVGNAQNFGDGQHSVTSTIPDDFGLHGERELLPTRDASVAGDRQSLTCEAPGPLDAIREYNRLALDVDVVGDTIPNTYQTDLILSATEVATPTNANTPDLGLTDQAIHEGRRFIEGLMRLTSQAEQGRNSTPRPATATSAPSPNQALPKSPAPSQEQLQSVFRSAAPHALQKIVSYLAPLHNLLNSIPNVANVMREHSDRLSSLENVNSFNFVHPESMDRTVEALDSRVHDLETRMDDHEALHQAIDADQSSRSRRMATESFGSNPSLESTTSSALILAAVEREGVATEMETIKDRLDTLEAAAMPTSHRPWEVEVVLLPWGRDLRGIWFSSDEPMHDPAMTITQDSEEWTQARSSALGQTRTSLVPFRDLDSSPHPSGRSAKSSHPFSDTESGWSSQEISEWVSGSAHQLLSPKASGSNNLVYKRLKSRGLVVDVKLASASASDIQAAISHAFKHLLDRFRYTEDDENSMTKAYPGLQACFIPLRKIAKDSRLRFLTPAEMASSALWSAQFLKSGILMSVTGGKKRLYVTQREAYIQPMSDFGAWTWQQLRLLPRRQEDLDTEMEGNEEHCQPEVPEADAREACWSYFEAYDAPPISVNSSFGSNHSNAMQLSMRPADKDWRRSMTPLSILKNRQPISPLSEFHPQRPSRQRTVSASIIEPMSSTAGKRRLNSSPIKQTSAPQTQAGASTSMSRQKRRRVTSSSPQPESAHEAQITIWANTPRRSREPQSPFFSSEPQLLPIPRTNSDLASRPSQRSLAAAYATPHSGAFSAAHDYDHGGDTEPDDDEQSWRGLTTGESDNEDAHGGAEIEVDMSFSGDEGFASEDSESSENEDISDSILGTQIKEEDDEDDEEDDDGVDIYDRLLGVLQSQ